MSSILTFRPWLEFAKTVRNLPGVSSYFIGLANVTVTPPDRDGFNGVTFIWLPGSCSLQLAMVLSFFALSSKNHLTLACPVQTAFGSAFPCQLSGGFSAKMSELTIINTATSSVNDAGTGLPSPIRISAFRSGDGCAGVVGIVTPFNHGVFCSSILGGGPPPSVAAMGGASSSSWHASPELLR